MDEDDQHGLPEYGDAATQAVRYTQNLQNGIGKDWLSFVVRSRAKKPQHRPLFVTADTIEGTVKIDFDQAGGAKEVSLAVVASVTAVGQEEKRVLYIPSRLWDGKGARGAKSTGSQFWPFSVKLPNEHSGIGKSKQPARSYPLPPSFSERGSPVYVDYKLEVTVKRGIFKTDQTFVYLPISHAEPPSRLRQTAYRNGSTIVGPEGDPEGWHVCPPAMIAGVLFDARQVVARYSLALAEPMSYARGSPIPLSLTIDSGDEQALDLLAAPRAVRVHLFRSRVLGQRATDESAVRRSDQVFQEKVGTAYFWTPERSVFGSSSRTLWGELVVRSDSKPSFIFPGFALQYALVLFPPQAAGFTPKIPPDDALLTQKVTVTTLGAPGMVVRSAAPPGYEYPEEADFTNTLGYLENGNQRFLHHGAGGTFSVG